MMPFESAHVQMEKIEEAMVAWFMANLGEHQPFDQKKLLDLYLSSPKGTLTNLQAFSRILSCTEERGMAEKGPDGLWRLTKTGEALFIVVRGKLPKGSRTFPSITPSTARKVKAAGEAWRPGQKEASE